jgi:hypothetical protein
VLGAGGGKIGAGLQLREYIKFEAKDTGAIRSRPTVVDVSSQRGYSFLFRFSISLCETLG